MLLMWDAMGYNCGIRYDKHTGQLIGLSEDFPAYILTVEHPGVKVMGSGDFSSILTDFDFQF